MKKTLMQILIGDVSSVTFGPQEIYLYNIKGIDFEKISEEYILNFKYNKKFELEDNLNSLELLQKMISPLDENFGKNKMNTTPSKISYPIKFDSKKYKFEIKFE